MVGFVFVSHSQKLAEGVAELCGLMAQSVPMRAAGGLEDGTPGTSFEKIAAAVEEIYSEDGVIILADLGSSVMTSEMVMESMEGRRIAIGDCPLVEGAVTGTVDASAGMPLEEILAEINTVGSEHKLI